MSADDCDNATRVELARIDERVKALWRDISRSELGSERALKIASDELARRLDMLNHAHEEAQRIHATTVSRELFDQKIEEIFNRLGGIENAASEQRGRLWIPMAGISALVAALTQAATRLFIH